VGLCDAPDVNSCICSFTPEPLRAAHSRTGVTSCPGTLLTKPCPPPPRPLQSYEEQELLRLVYYGGVQPEIRKAVWPFLLGHYHFGMTEAERKEVSHREQPPGSLGALTPC
jgi:hypothetical protein